MLYDYFWFLMVLLNSWVGPDHFGAELGSLFDVEIVSHETLGLDGFESANFDAPIEEAQDVGVR